MKLKNIWSSEWDKDIEFVSMAIRHLSLNTNAKILDIGTGQGIMAVSLAVRGYRVTTGEPEEGSHEHEHYE